MMQRILALVLFVMGSWMVGCGAPPVIDPAQPSRHSLTLTMFASTTDSRLTWFELDASGALTFAGGRSALTHHGQSAGELTDADKQRLLTIIDHYKLLQAPNHFLAKGKRVTYQVELSVDRFSHAFTAEDEDVPGLDQLHQTLMDIQSRNRYRDLPVIQKLQK